MPAHLLDDDEEVVLVVRPHWSFMAVPVVAALVAVVAAVAVDVAASPPSAAAIALVAAVGLAVVWLFGRYVRWATTSLVVTDRRVVARSGVISTRTREIPVDRVNDVTVYRSLLEHLIGRGTLVIECGGEAAQEVVAWIPSPRRVQRAIHLQLQGRHAAARASAPPDRRRSLADDLHELEDLRRSGLISPGEFETKRAELLHRL